MKNLLFFIIFCIIANITNAQKHDNIWPMGYIGDTAANACNYYIDFTTDTFSIVPFCLGANFIEAGNAAISDTAGNLLFYSNGTKIIDSSHNLMLNGGNLNNNSDPFVEYQGYPAELLILPSPINSSKYHVFHIERGTGGVLSGYALHLNYTQVDMNLNNGLGAVTTKNIPILNDTLGGWGSLLEAAKHANGTDWWVLIPEWRSNAYYRFLVTEDTILGPYRQEVGPAFHWIDYNGQAVFSPDASLYVRYDPYNEAELYDFNRCTGELTYRQHIDVPSNRNAGGAAISANSRFLYINNDTIVFQYDLHAADINSSRSIVAIYDGFQSPQFFGTNFWQMQLAPNGKIYGTSTNSTDRLHVIDYPDSAGVACSFRQHAIQVPPYNGISLPNYPHFRTLALPDGACDTVVAIRTIALGEYGIRLWPNPAQNQVNIELQDYIGASIESIALFSINGQKLHSSFVAAQNNIYSLDISHLPNGVYACKVLLDDKRYYHKRFVVLRY